MNSQQPLVSIIIPTYNRAHLIGETLESVIAQTYSKWECIVVDDGSTDRTDEVIHKYLTSDNRFQYYHRPQDSPKGANACRNYGFEKSKGSYILWFDSDDLMMPEKIEVQLNALLNDPKLDFCIAKFSNFNSNNSNIEEISYLRNSNKFPNYKEYLRHQLFWGTIDFLGKRNVLENVFFNEYLKSGQEYHFFVLVLLNKPKGVFLDKTLAKRRIHNESIQQKIHRNPHQKYLNKVDMYWCLYEDGKNKFDTKDEVFLMRETYLFLQYLMKFKVFHPKLNKIHKEAKSKFGVFKVFKLRSLLWLSYFSGKGDLKIRKLIKSYF